MLITAYQLNICKPDTFCFGFNDNNRMLCSNPHTVVTRKSYGNTFVHIVINGFLYQSTADINRQKIPEYHNRRQQQKQQKPNTSIQWFSHYQSINQSKEICIDQ